ncbi:N-acyl-L-amino acid amidohydrolase [Kordiimonas sediminis]|uniref:N-acyl-L-amino acid amidohydrolase n=1 Tax=Kordiimonas sediminis TaxID=1735581 RepID=A0A919AX01_9PROT|nr:amidohydrolase [Kordiimonas sediminis]GHF30308.1 N-acyl-L-amino acid amidohydrolase [Kordiimonas sediminis]
MQFLRALAFGASLTAISYGAVSASDAWQDKVDAATKQVMPTVVELRHHFHANPELGNREFKTSAKIAEHLKSLGIEVETGVAHTGIVGTLKGGKPGSVVALRADIDGLPVQEKTGLPFASKVTTMWQGVETGVMHACGHDAHISILLGVAEVLAGMRDEIPGTVKFFFQPAEEGAPEGEEGGAELMIKEGVLDGADAPKAIFGLHVFPGPPGVISYKPEGFLAAADSLYIKIKGVQTHGSMPWGGVDPIAVSAQVVNGLQTIVSRQVDISTAPAVVTVGSINGGNRGNIIPEDVTMTGTIRTFDMAMRDDIHMRIKRTAEKIAESYGAEAEVVITKGYPVTVNDPALTADMAPILDRSSAGGKAYVVKPVMGAEDFSFFQQKIPGLFFGLGVSKANATRADMAPNHSPYFYVNDDALPSGVKALSSLALDWLHKNSE